MKKAMILMGCLSLVSCGTADEIKKIKAESEDTASEEGATTYGGLETKSPASLPRSSTKVSVEVNVESGGDKTCPVAKVSQLIEAVGLPTRIQDGIEDSFTLVYPVKKSADCRLNPKLCDREEMCEDTKNWTGCTITFTDTSKGFKIDSMINMNESLRDYLEGCF